MSAVKTWQLFVDGASRGNPGPAGAGAHLLKQDQLVAQRGYYLGQKTNNEAEYLALLIGMFMLKKRAASHDKVHVFSDSLLLIRQMSGQYRVRKPELQRLHALVVEHSNMYECTFEHVYREDNTQADALANLGIDKKTSLPLSFISLLRTHEIHI